MEAIVLIIRVVIGVLFLYSGYTKLFPIEPFEFSFVDTGFINWQLAPFVARVLIGAEFFIGLSFLFRKHLPMWFFSGVVFLLIIFSLYLACQIYLYGNTGNCGCFGEAIQLTPLAAIIKNIITFAGVIFIYHFSKNLSPARWMKWFLAGAIVLSMAIPFIVNPVELDAAQDYLKTDKINEPLELDLLYKHASLNAPPANLNKGKHLISFVSLKCPHCRIAAKKLHVIYDRHPEISMLLVLNGDNENLDDFFNRTRAKNIPHCMLLGKPFVQMAGVHLPRIYLVHDGTIEYSINYYDLDETYLLNWYFSK